MGRCSKMAYNSLITETIKQQTNSIGCINERIMKNVHVLPTSQPSKLYTVDSIDKLDWSEGYLHQVDGATNKNIYITSDEEIKEGDYVLDDEQDVFQVLDINHTQGILRSDRFTYVIDICKKIILTTDQDLIKDGVQAIDDEFLKWFVKNPSCEEVEVEKTFVTNSGLGYQEYAVLDSNFKVIEINTKIPQASYYLGKVTILDTYEYVINYKIIIPKEKPKQDKIMERFIANAKQQETLEEAAESHVENPKIIAKFSENKAMYKKMFCEGAKWQMERSYSEEEVYNLLEEAMKDCYTSELEHHYSGDYHNLKEWFKQFKKK